MAKLESELGLEGAIVNRLKKGLASIGIAALAFTGITIATIPATADPGVGVANSCALRALVPVKTGTSLRANGGRGWCSNPATVTVSLKRDIPLWPDSTLNYETRQNITNSYWNVYGDGSAGRTYYTQTDSSTGATLQSSRMTL